MYVHVDKVTVKTPAYNKHLFLCKYYAGLLTLTLYAPKGAAKRASTTASAVTSEMAQVLVRVIVCNQA